MMLQQPSGSLEERLSHLEKTLPLLARLNEQQTLFDEIQKLNSNLDELVQSVERFAKGQSLENAEFKNKYELLALNAAKLSVELSDLNKSRIEHEKEHKNDLAICHDVHEDFAHKTELLNSSVKELRGMYSQLPTQNDLNLLANEQAKKLITPCAEIERISATMQDFKIALEGLAGQNGKLVTDFYSLKLLLEYVQKIYHDQEKARANELASMESNYKKIVEDLQKKQLELQKKLEQIVIVDPSQQKEEFIGMIDPVKLEANIAALRSNNNLSKITVLEKKIEQIYLLINKLELAK